MDFSIDPKIAELRDRVRGFVREELQPLERQKSLDEGRARARARGLFGLHHSLRLTEFAIVSEELGRSPLGHYAVGANAPDIGNQELLELAGTEEQKRRFLAPLREGKIRSCFSMTEPGRAGSNPTWMETRAVLDGGQWVIDGHKWFTTAADGAAFAIVMAVTNPDAPPHLRASMIIVPCDTPGFQLVRNLPVMGEPEPGVLSHGEIRYVNCRVPEANLLGGQGFGFALAQERLGPGRIHHCMRWIGICERALEEMCRYALGRELAPGHPLAAKQRVQEWIAESRAEIDAARLSVLFAAWKMEREGQKAARTQISAIKFLVAGTLQKVLDRAIQAHGALGMTDDLILAWLWRHERAARIYDGPDEVHKEVVARHVLRGFGR